MWIYYNRRLPALFGSFVREREVQEFAFCSQCDDPSDRDVADIKICCEMSRIDATNIFMVRSEGGRNVSAVTVSCAAQRNLDRNQNLLFTYGA